MDFLYDGCKIFDLYMMCYGCFMFHDIHVDFWPMMDTDTFLCRLLYDMTYMHYFDIDCSKWDAFIWCIFLYANIMNENVQCFYEIDVMFLNDESK